MSLSRRTIAWILAAICFASGLTAAPLVCARVAATAAAASHADCGGCGSERPDADCEDTACAARIAAAYHGVIALVSLPERKIVRQAHAALRSAAAPARSEPPDPPPPRAPGE